MEYDTSRLEDALPAEERVLVPIKISQLADKYDIPLLQESASKDLKEILSVTKDKNYKGLLAAVEYYYSYCAQTEAPIAKELTSYAVKQMDHSPQPKILFDLMKRCTLFGVDMAFTSLRGRNIIPSDFYNFPMIDNS